MSQDPIKLEGGNNLYLYASNPSIWIDPLGLSCTHANSRSSTKAQHVYEIRDTVTGRLVKVGISSGKVRLDGKSYRAESQVRKWDKMTNQPGRYKSKIVKKIPCGAGARQAALLEEQQRATRYYSQGLLTDTIPGTNIRYHSRP